MQEKMIPYEIREDQGEKEADTQSSCHPCSRSHSQSFQVFKALLIILRLLGNIFHLQIILLLTLS